MCTVFIAKLVKGNVNRGNKSNITTQKANVTPERKKCLVKRWTAVDDEHVQSEAHSIPGKKGKNVGLKGRLVLSKEMTFQ